MLKNPRYSAAGEFNMEEAINREVRKGYKPRAPARTEKPEEPQPNVGTSAVASMDPPPHVNKTVYSLAASVGMAQEYRSVYDGTSDIFQNSNTGGTGSKTTTGSFSRTGSQKKSSAATSEDEDYSKYLENFPNLTAAEKMERVAHHKEVSEFFRDLAKKTREDMAADSGM